MSEHPATGWQRSGHERLRVEQLLKFCQIDCPWQPNKEVVLGLRFNCMVEEFQLKGSIAFYLLCSVVSIKLHGTLTKASSKSTPRINNKFLLFLFESTFGIRAGTGVSGSSCSTAYFGTRFPTCFQFRYVCEPNDAFQQYFGADRRFGIVFSFNRLHICQRSSILGSLTTSHALQNTVDVASSFFFTEFFQTAGKPRRPRMRNLKHIFSYISQ
mmetsp:Transcript_16297/g.33334  ORF Transcript_16297/g.33334 Transcript_16297/m.33334 type:complete len:213 (-) Transcript_16297:6-644(-)